MLFIRGEVAHSRGFSRDAYRRAAESKEMFIVLGIGQWTCTTKIKLIPFDKLTAFFRQHLN